MFLVTFVAQRTINYGFMVSLQRPRIAYALKLPFNVVEHLPGIF